MEVVPQLNLNKNLNERNPFLGKCDPAVLTPEVVETLKRQDTQLSQNSCSSLPQREETETSRIRWRQCRGRCCGAIRARTPCVRALTRVQRGERQLCCVAVVLAGGPGCRRHPEHPGPRVGHGAGGPGACSAVSPALDYWLFFFRASAPYLLKRHLTETQY